MKESITRYLGKAHNHATALRHTKRHTDTYISLMVAKVPVLFETSIN